MIERANIDGALLPLGLAVGESWVDMLDQMVVDRTSGKRGGRWMQVKDVLSRDLLGASVRLSP